jgi:amidase
MGHPMVVMLLGLQIVGHRWREMELLAIAQQLDEIVGNLRHPPAN